MSVSEEFRTLFGNCQIPSSTIASISYRYKRITKQLNTDFWNSTSDTNHSLYVGSYGRDTAAKGLSDLDVCFELPAALYAQYNAHSNNGQSALLQAVKTSIRRTYSTSDSFGDGQVVVVAFDDGITFEILPVFVNTSGTYTYPNANGGGSWKVCNPRAEIQAVSARDQSTSGNMKTLSRMLRVWRDYCNVPMSGILLDTLTYQFLENYVNRDKSFTYYDWIFRDLFDFISKQNPQQSSWRAPGSQSYVGRTGSFEFKAKGAHLRSLEAIAYDVAKQDWSRKQKWREVFGSAYPS